MYSQLKIHWTLIGILLGLALNTHTHASGWANTSIYRSTTHCVTVSGTTSPNFHGTMATSAAAAVKCPIFFYTKVDEVSSIWTQFKRTTGSPNPYCTVIVYDLYGKELWSKTQNGSASSKSYYDLKIDISDSPLTTDQKGYAYLSCVFYKNDAFVHYGWVDTEQLW